MSEAAPGLLAKWMTSTTLEEPSRSSRACSRSAPARRSGGGSRAYGGDLPADRLDR